MRNKHQKSLEMLVNNLSRITDLNNDSMKNVYVEPQWYNSNGDPISLCDIIVDYKGIGIPMELKQSLIKRDKAIKQLNQGVKYIEEELGVEKNEYGFFILYDLDIPLSLNPFTIETIYL